MDGDLEDELGDDLGSDLELGDGLEDELGVSDDLDGDLGEDLDLSEPESLGSPVDLDQADIDVEVDSVPQLKKKVDKTKELTHEENLERQIEDETLDDKSVYDIDEPLDDIEYEEADDDFDESEYEEVEQGTSFKAKVQNFFSGLSNRGEGDESKTTIMEKATQIFKLIGGTKLEQAESTEKKGLKEKFQESTQVLQDKIPALGKILGKKNQDATDAIDVTQGEVTEASNLGEVTDSDLELIDEGTLQIELNEKPKGKFVLTRQTILILLLVPILAWVAYDELMVEEVPEPPPIKQRPKNEAPKPKKPEPVEPTKVPEPIEPPPAIDPEPQPIEPEPTEQPVEQPAEQPVEPEPTEQPVEEPIEQPVEPEPEPTEQPVEQPAEPEPQPEIDPNQDLTDALDQVVEDQNKEPEREEPAPSVEPMPNEQPTPLGESGGESTMGMEGDEQILPQDIIEPEASNEITKQLLQDLEVKLKEERKEQELVENVKPTSAPTYDNTGPGLVYNCTDEHWACVNLDSYNQCRGNYSWNKQQGADTECYPYARLENEVDCGTVQQEKIDTVSETKFCN